jgi:hypothetical protein
MNKPVSDEKRGESFPTIIERRRTEPNFNAHQDTHGSLRYSNSNHGSLQKASTFPIASKQDAGRIYCFSKETYKHEVYKAMFFNVETGPGFSES